MRHTWSGKNLELGAVGATWMKTTKLLANCQCQTQKINQPVPSQGAQSQEALTQAGPRQPSPSHGAQSLGASTQASPS